MEEAFKALLLNDASLVALVGSRVNWVLRPQEIAGLPALVLQVVSTIPEYDMDGKTGLTSSRIQIDAYAATYGAARRSMRAALAVLSGFSGVFSGIDFQGIFQDSERDFQTDDTGGDQRLFRTQADVIVWHCPI